MVRFWKDQSPTQPLRTLPKLLILAAIGLSLNVRAVCAGDVPTEAPEQIKQLLADGSQPQRVSLATRFGLVIPATRRHGAKSDIPCTDYDAVTVHRVKLMPSWADGAVIQVYSPSCWYSYFVVLEETEPNTWRYLQTLTAGAHYTSPRVSFESLIAPDEKEIIVQDNQTAGGTGILVKDLTIWRLSPDGLHVVLDEPTEVNFAIPLNFTHQPHNSDQHQDSDFSFVNPAKLDAVGALVKFGKSENTGLKAIVAKEIIRDHQTRIVRWWEFVWNPAIQKFQKHPWYPPSR